MSKRTKPDKELQEILERIYAYLGQQDDNEAAELRDELDGYMDSVS